MAQRGWAYFLSQFTAHPEASHAPILQREKLRLAEAILRSGSRTLYWQRHPSDLGDNPGKNKGDTCGAMETTQSHPYKSQRGRTGPEQNSRHRPHIPKMKRTSTARSQTLGGPRAALGSRAVLTHTLYGTVTAT